VNDLCVFIIVAFLGSPSVRNCVYDYATRKTPLMTTSGGEA
jgi:hypothetical protein